MLGYLGIIAECLSARQLILHRISPSVCLYVCVTLRNVMLRNANVSRLGMQFYCKRVFKMASYQSHGCRLCTFGARRTRDQDKSFTSFYPGRLTTAPTRLEPLFQQRSDRWRRTVRGLIASDTNVSFKQLCSPVAAITGPWNCVLYRDSLLLKAHLRSRNFSSNCVGDAAPKPHLLNARARGLHCVCIALVLYYFKG